MIAPIPWFRTTARTCQHEESPGPDAPHTKAHEPTTRSWDRRQGLSVLPLLSRALRPRTLPPSVLGSGSTGRGACGVGQGTRLSRCIDIDMGASPHGARRPSKAVGRRTATLGWVRSPVLGALCAPFFQRPCCSLCASSGDRSLPYNFPLGGVLHLQIFIGGFLHRKRCKIFLGGCSPPSDFHWGLIADSRGNLKTL